MFEELLKNILPTFEIIIYVILILLPLIVLVHYFERFKNTFFALRSREFELKQEMVLLEIRNPKEITKSPMAMEIVLSSFLNTGGEGSWLSKKWQGKSRPKYSLEMVSIDGNVRFYIWVRKGLKKLVESSFYSQYPTVEMNEVPDYTQYFSYKHDASGGFAGSEFKLKKADPIPIKTYKQFGLDKKTKAEEIIDPVSFIIEVLGNISKNENFWVQFVIRGQKKDYKKDLPLWKSLLNFKPEMHDWKDLAEKEITELKEQLMEEGEDGIKFQKITTDKEKEVIQSIIENVNKPSYWVGIRAIYFATEGNFDSGSKASLGAIFQPLNSNEFNEFGGGFGPGFDYSWQDPKGERSEKLKETMFYDYRKRKFFEAGEKEKKVWPNKSRYPTFVLSVEELATIFHPPTAASATPNFERIESKRATAPPNLPI